MKEIQQQTFIRQIGRLAAKPNGQTRYCFILGAGASRPSGIPTGAELAKRWYNEIIEYYHEDDRQWLADEKIDESNAANFYSRIYQKRFEQDKREGFQFLQETMESIEPSFGYSVLAQILSQTRNNVVITTNFDSLTEDALFTFTNKKPLVCGHESLTDYVELTTTRPIIAKIHRDILFQPKSAPEELSELSEKWKNVLRRVFETYTPIVIGYGGNDDSLMNYMDEISASGKGLYWCYRSDPPEERIKDIVNKWNGHFVNIAGFDEVMMLLLQSLDLKLLDSHISEVAKSRSRRYREQAEKLAKETKEKSIKDAFKFVSKDFKTWWDVDLAAKAEESIEAKELIYENGIKKFSDSHELLVSYAVFLEDFKGDYEEAERIYLKSIELNPDYYIATSNYALFLHRRIGDYDKAEKYYKESIKSNPSDAITIGNYGYFLERIRKNYDKAEKYYKQSLELDPNSFFTNINYGIFLSSIRKKTDEAEQVYEKLLRIYPDNGRVHTWYGYLLETQSKSYDKAEEHYKKALAINPNEFDSNSNYAVFLTTVKNKIEEAEKYYLKAYEIDSKNLFNLGNLAENQFLLGKTEEGERYVDEGLSQKSIFNENLLSLWSSRYIFLPDKYPEAKETLIELLNKGARLKEADFSKGIAHAKANKHPDLKTLQKIVDVIIDKASLSTLK